MEERGWRMNWAEEREKRLRHLDGLPGKLHHERFEVLNRASRLFSSNGVELSNHIGRFVGTTEYSSNLPDEFEHEAVRFFHNYIASVATLRDMQRTTHRKLWPERIPEEDRRDEFDRRTVWEVEVYEAKVAELFGDDDIKFLFDLRNCALHHTVPMMAIGTRVSWEAGHYYEHANTVELKRSELDKFSSWGGPAKRFLRTQEKDVEFLPYFRSTRHAPASFSVGSGSRCTRRFGWRSRSTTGSAPSSATGWPRKMRNPISRNTSAGIRSRERSVETVRQHARSAARSGQLVGVESASTLAVSRW